jgi:malate dehydrogenase (oxaloacetate-decarboxylating)
MHAGGSLSLIFRLELDHEVGVFARLAQAVGEAGGDIRAVDLIQATRTAVIRDVTVDVYDPDGSDRVVEAVRRVPGVAVRNVSDRTFLLHLGGKIEVRSRVPIKNRDDLSMVYTPGVARVALAVHEDPAKAFTLTMKGNTVAVVTDGTAVLGLGDVGPAAALPVMEGKAMLFKEFAGVNAVPVCLDTRDPDEIVRTVVSLAPGFGGINLEDISAPRCFQIEEELRRRLDIPVFHDDQHGTAIVILAGLFNALRIVGKRMADLKVVVVGMGAAGVACSRALMGAGVVNLIGVDRAGALVSGVDYDNPTWREFARDTNPERLRGTVSDVIAGADVFIGLSGPGVLSPADVRRMARDPIVFALANPAPEIDPDAAAPYVRVMATGRSDYPNQVNNVLAFPGVFKGALRCRARAVTPEMELAAARAIAGVVGEDELMEEYIIPSVFNRRVVQAVAAAVADAAVAAGVARRDRPALAEEAPDPA